MSNNQEVKTAVVNVPDNTGEVVMVITREDGRQETQIIKTNLPSKYHFTFKPRPDDTEEPQDYFAFWPVKDQQRKLTQKFANNPDYYLSLNALLPGHDGLDFFCNHGDEIVSVWDGVVYQVHTNQNTHNYGKHVRVRHPNGYKTIYAHLSDVKVGMNDRIEGGETVLGLAGNTGNVWPEPTPQNPFLGTHLHLTVKHDNAKKGGSLYVGFGYNIADPSDLVEPLLGEQSSGSGQSGSNAGSNQGSSQNVRYVSASAGLFLRPVMNTSQPEIDRMPYASRVTVISEHGNWLKVDYNGKTGYAWKGWLSRDKPNNR